MTEKQVDTLAHDTREIPVKLYCSPSDFRDFLSSMLGKPQTISKLFRGAFDIGVEHVTDLHSLITQRVDQQNKASLIQFTAKIVFDDNSSVLLGSIDEFRTYREIRPVSSQQLHLSWIFLVQFQDKEAPEKQEIDISFLTSDGPLSVIDSEGPVIFRLSKLKRGIIQFRIRHTARTWGADIEALLSGHIETLMDSPGKFRSFIWRHSERISIAAAGLFFMASVFICYWTAASIWTDQKIKIASMIGESIAISPKIDFILETVSASVWARYFFSVIIFLIGSFIVAAILGVWIESLADTNKPSFIVLTAQSTKERKNVLKKYERNYVLFFVSIGLSVLSGFLANLLFHYFWKQYLS